MAMLYVNGEAVKDPSSLTWGLQDISSSEAGRTDDINATMHKCKITNKRKLSLGWQNIKPAEAAKILSQFEDEYFQLTYPDVKTNSMLKKEFYCGDITCPFRWWHRYGKYYSELSFEVVER